MSRLLTCSLLLVLACLTVTPAFAGDGSITNGRLDLLVYFDYDEQDPESWQPMFDAASELLYDATEQGLQLGTISMTKCPDLKALADIWIRDEVAGAAGHRNGLGKVGKHIFLTQLHKSTSGEALGQFGLVHQLGHYLWGLHAQHTGFLGDTPATLDGHLSAVSETAIASIMDGGTTIAPNNTRTEFSTPVALDDPDTAHNPGLPDNKGRAQRTRQAYLLAQSDWERIADSGVGGLAVPVVPPTSDITGHQTVLYDYSRFQAALGLSLIIDRSGSMQSDNKMTLAIQGAQTCIGLMRNGEHLNVTAFNNQNQVLVPTITLNEASKSNAIGIVGNLVPTGGTFIGEAVLEGVSQLTAVEGCQESLILLTDGQSQSLNANSPPVLAALEAGNHVLYTIALGFGTDDPPLIDAANVTGGKFFKVTDPAQLPDVFTEIFAEVAGWSAGEEETDQVLAPAASQDYDFDLSVFATTATVVLNYPPGTVLDAELTTPGGTTFNIDTPPAGVTVFESIVQTSVTLEGPEAGTWTADVTNNGAQADYDFLTFLESEQLEVAADVVAQTTNYPDPMALSLSVVAGVPVGGAGVSATVFRPDATTVDIQMFDDGLPVHGDEDADDGIYSALFTQFTVNGVYQVFANVDNVDGESAVVLLGEEGTTSALVPPFATSVRQGVTLAGFPGLGAIAPSAATLVPHPALVAPDDPIDLDETAPTGLAGFALTLTGDEPTLLGPVAFDIDAGGKTEQLERLTLHLDGDGDGVIDSPSVPLAFGEVIDGQLVFNQPDDELALLASGTTHHFLVSGGDGLALAALGDGVLLPRGPAEPAAPPLWALVLLAAGALLSVVRALIRRLPEARPRRLAWAASLVLAATVVTGCHRGSSDERGGATAVAVSLPPTGVTANGAVLVAPTAVAGAPLAFEFKLN